MLWERNFSLAVSHTPGKGRCLITQSPILPWEKSQIYFFGPKLCCPGGRVMLAKWSFFSFTHSNVYKFVNILLQGSAEIFLLEIWAYKKTHIHSYLSKSVFSRYSQTIAKRDWNWFTFSCRFQNQYQDLSTIQCTGGWDSPRSFGTWCWISQLPQRQFCSWIVNFCCWNWRTNTRGDLWSMIIDA